MKKKAKSHLNNRTAKLLAFATITILSTLFVLITTNFIANTNLLTAERPFKSPKSDFDLGHLYFNNGDIATGHYDLQTARYHFSRVVSSGDVFSSAGERAISWYQLGRIDFLEGRFDAAIYKFSYLINEFGETSIPSSHYMLGLTYAYRARDNGVSKDWESAAESFKKFLDIKPESPWARTDLSWIYFAQGKFAEMIPLLEEGLSYEPNSPWLLNMYGLALMNTGDISKSVVVFEKAKESASKLNTIDWGRAYPGNDPSLWEEGLATFRAAIDQNLSLAKSQE